MRPAVFMLCSRCDRWREGDRIAESDRDATGEIGYGGWMPADFIKPNWQPARFAGRRVAAVGLEAGAKELGAGIYELAPGAVGSPLHLHHANEELLFVLDGTVSLRGPDGTQVLSAGAVIAFPRGEEGTHSLVNRSDVLARYLVVSTTNRPDVLEYPDIGATYVVLEDRRRAYSNDTDKDAVIDDAMRAAGDPTLD